MDARDILVFIWGWPSKDDVFHPILMDRQIVLLNTLIELALSLVISLGINSAKRLWY